MTNQQALAQAMEFARSGQATAASNLLERVLADDPANADALQLLGMIARGQKDNNKAVELFRQSLRSRPDQPHVLNNLGNALLDLERPRDAIDAYGTAISLQPDYFDAMTNLGIAYLAAEEPKDAAEWLERVVRVHPRNPKAWSALGRARRALGELNQALAAFRTSLTLRPGHVATLHNYAVALRLAGQPSEAAALLEQCAAAAGQSVAIRYNLGHCYYDMGRLEQAADAYEAAVALQPGDRDAHDALNRLYWQTGNRARYLRSYAAALRDRPSDSGLIADLANRLNLEGRVGDTIALLNEALRRGVDGAALRHRLGQANWAERRFEEALKHYARAIDADPAAAEPRLELARSLIILERYEDALQELAPVLEQNPFDQQAIAYQGLAWRFLEDPRADRLNDYNRFVQQRVLQPSAVWGNVASFNRRLEEVLAALHNTSQHPLEQTLRGGTQTMGDLFGHNAPEIVAVRKMIEVAVGDYIRALPDDPDHLFLKRKGPFRFEGSWSVRLRSQGFHVNHVHSQGWISSCYYVGVPRAVDRDGQQGWIKFGETGLSLGVREGIAKAVRPEVGTLVLFPSYMYHGTIPFEDDAYRTTIAFDVVPAG